MRTFSLVILITASLNAFAEPAPPTPRRPVESRLHDVSIRDDYRWLEQEQAPEVRQWLAAQTRYARAWLDASPARDAIAARVRSIALFDSPSFGVRAWRGGRWFLSKRQPPRQQAWIVSRATIDDAASERVILDPNRIDPSGATSVDWWRVSLDGKLLAAAMCKNGSERGSLHLFDAVTGKALPDVIPRVQAVGGGGSATFTADGTGLYYTRYPHEGERSAADLDFYEEIWFHKIGTPVEQDHYVLGKEFPRIAEIRLDSSDDGGVLLARVANGDGGEAAFWLGKPGGAWQPLARFEDKVFAARFGRDGALYLLSRDHAPNGKILRLPLNTPRLDAARVVVPENEGAIDSFEVTSKHLFVVTLDGGPNRVRVLTLDGKAVRAPELLPVASVGGAVRGPGDELVFWQENALTPYAYWRWAGGAVTRTTLQMKTNVDFSDCEVVRRFARSKDGTAVPYTIVRKKGLALDGNNPTLLTGYGGYGLSETPFFWAQLRVFVEQGGVFVDTNLRGGGEYGEAWHEAGKLLRKQNVFDDFTAVARALIEEKITSPAHLAIEGGSNGGLLMGATLTQHPDLFHAVVISRGILDMVRFERIPNGTFNTTEFGSTADAAQFKAIYAYSPYHHVVDGQRYPSVLLMTGTNDGRVSPSDSFKMAARLQAANRGGGVILLRSSDKTGHGMGSALDERIAEAIDYWSFLFRELGVAYTPVSARAQR